MLAHTADRQHSRLPQTHARGMPVAGSSNVSRDDSSDAAGSAEVYGFVGFISSAAALGGVHPEGASIIAPQPTHPRIQAPLACRRYVQCCTSSGRLCRRIFSSNMESRTIPQSEGGTLVHALPHRRQRSQTEWLTAVAATIAGTGRWRFPPGFLWPSYPLFALMKGKCTPKCPALVPPRATKCMYALYACACAGGYGGGGRSTTCTWGRKYRGQSCWLRPMLNSCHTG